MFCKRFNHHKASESSLYCQKLITKRNYITKKNKDNPSMASCSEPVKNGVVYLSQIDFLVPPLANLARQEGL